MAHALLAALLVLSSAAAAQTPPVPAPASPSETAPEVEASDAAPVPAAAPRPASGDVDTLRRDLEEARREMQEMREEFRAQLASQEAAEGWDAEWTQERRKLELFVFDGYFRVRPDLFHKFDLGRAPDPGGYRLFPQSVVGPEAGALGNERTQAGVNMRFRFEPTLNISEEVRVRMQVDALDNVIFGSTPDYAFTRSQRDLFSVFSENQNPPRSAINAVQDSITVRRVYGEVGTPVGLLRFGRMGAHWGLGMLRNDGNCLNCDFGDTVDRLQLVTEPLPGSGLYVTPFIDFNAEGPTSAVRGQQGQPFDLSNSDDAQSYSLIVAKRDTDQQARSKLDNNQSVFNYGVYFTYRSQRNDPVAFYRPEGGQFVGEGGEVDVRGAYVKRSASLYIPDAWVKFERKRFLIEMELAATVGSIENRA
ncbi:MAG TPA: TIGR04551 family protein, partial [Myxococcaceae bacterium]|nr:TIGR04551 family protein [Myxococcaceae bacterium]